MNTVFTFDIEDVQTLRTRAEDVWMEQILEDTPQGWSKSPVDLADLVATFPPLHIKPGFTLRAYQFRARNDGSGVVWAMPQDVPFPEPDECLTTDPQRPSGALNDVMEAIGGDGSPLSYLCASLFEREAVEFGAVGHGIYWYAFHIIGDDPWADPDIPRPIHAAPDEGPAGTSDEWQWIEPKPLEWRPTVRIDDDKVTVVFYTFCGLGSQRITRHIDTYKKGNYSFIGEGEMIASGPGGYVW